MKIAAKNAKGREEKKKTWCLGAPSFGGKVFEERKVRVNGMMNDEEKNEKTV